MDSTFTTHYPPTTTHYPLLQTMRPMRHRPSRAKSGSDENGLGDLGFGAAGRLGALVVNLNAVWALRSHCDSECDQLLGLCRKRPIRHRRFVEGNKSLPRRRRQLAESLELLDVVH